MKLPLTLTLLSLGIFKSIAGDLPKPLVYFDFNDVKSGRAMESNSSGSAKLVAVPKLPPPDYKPTDAYWSKNGDGLSEKTRDFALDFSKSPGMGSDAIYGICAVSDAPLNDLKSLTMTGWFKTATPIDKGARLFDFVDMENTGFLLIANSGKLAFQVSGQGWLSTLEFNQTNEWIFFALSYDSTKTKDNVIFYHGDKNGKLTSETFSSKDSILPSDNVKKILFIGNVGGYSRPFQGLLDNMAVYGSTKDDSGALNERQIKAILRAEAKSPAATEPEASAPQ